MKFYPSKRQVFFILFFLVIISIFTYLCVRLFFFIAMDYPWYEKIFAFLLLLAELFILIHSTGYFLNIFRVVKSTSDASETSQMPNNTYPPVAIVVASFKEPIEVVRDTLICFYNLSYPNKHLYFLDDTRYDLPWDTPENKEKYHQSIDELCQWIGVNLFRANWHGAKAGMLNDFLQYLQGNIRPDFEMSLYANKEKKETEKYLIVFDADMNPLPNFVEDLVLLMEKKPKAAFVQTPQYYTNFQTNRVARAAGLQQAIFYEYICEGKGLQDAMFCCGTNVLLRREALQDVGGFDENSVTEDFSTSLKFHLHGWQSLYFNRVSAFGMGPEDLGGYFKQQFRWARGTVGILKRLPGEMFKNFGKISLNKWWEYFLSCTHYFVGWVLFIMIISPIFYLFFDVPSYYASPAIYVFVYTPYIVLTSFMFFWTLRERRYRSIDLLSALLINSVTFPVYMKATLYALLGIDAKFGVTPKGGSTILSLRSLFPQLFICLLCFAAVVWGLQRLYFEHEPFYALAINTFWCFFNFVFVSFVLYFNHANEIENE